MNPAVNSLLFFFEASRGSPAVPANPDLSPGFIDDFFFFFFGSSFHPEASIPLEAN